MSVQLNIKQCSLTSVAMCSAWHLVLFVAVSWVSRTAAIAPCSDTIIQGLSRYKECYTDGNPPSQFGGGLATHVVYVKGEIPSDARCLTTHEDEKHTYATVYYSNKSEENYQWNAFFYSNHVDEIMDGSNIKYRLYVIHNENGAFSYYRCIAEGSSGTGTHAAFVLVNCADTTNPSTLEVVDKAKMCFDEVNITDYYSIQPCEC